MHSTDPDKAKPDVLYVEDLIASVPALQQLYEEHLHENDTLLPHVFFGEITRYVISKVCEAQHDHSIGRLLNELEKGVEKGPEAVRDLIRASFVENLCGETDAIKALKPLMGEKLKFDVLAMCGE
jgi:hypothetical protein